MASFNTLSAKLEFMDRIQQRAYRGNMTSTVHENSCILNMQHR